MWKSIQNYSVLWALRLWDMEVDHGSHWHKSPSAYASPLTQSNSRYHFSLCKISSTSFRCCSDSSISFLDLFSEDLSQQDCQSQPLSTQAFTFTELTVLYIGLSSVLKSTSVSDNILQTLFFPVMEGEPTVLRIFPNDLFYFFYIVVKSDCIDFFQKLPLLLVNVSRYLLNFFFSSVSKKDLESRWWSFRTVLGVSDHDTSEEHLNNPEE